jgi:hypothetical protein
MSIASTTTIQAYQLRNGGTPARMAILRMIAADSANNHNPDTRLQPGDWRGARRYTLGRYQDAYCSGLHSAADGTWYCHHGIEEHFRAVRDSTEIDKRRAHGYVTDVGCDATAHGVVYSIPHGRYLAGYRWTDGGESHVVFPGVFADEYEAAQMADEHARVFANQCMAQSEKDEALLRAESGIDDSLDIIATRLTPADAAKLDALRAQLAELVETARNAQS